MTPRSERYTGPERRNGNGSNEWTSLSAWAKAIGIVGIPGAIAIFLVYAGAQTLPQISKTLEVLVTEVRQLEKLQSENIELSKRIIRISERTCSNAAGKDDNARQRCFDQ